MQQPPAKFQSNKDQWYMFWERKGCGAACWRFVGSRVLAKHGKWASSIEICMYFLFFVDFDFLSLEICFDKVARRNIISSRFRFFSCISNGQKQVEWTCCEAATLSLEIVKRLFIFFNWPEDVMRLPYDLLLPQDWNYTNICRGVKWI